MSTQLPTPESQTFRFQIRKRTVYNTLMVAVAAFLASTLIGLAATTISTNISTDGTLSVTGRATTTASLVVGDTQPGPFDLGTGDLWASAQATTSGNLGVGQGSAGDDDSIFFDADSSEYLAWLNTRGLFSLSDDLEVSGNATSTTRLVVGTTNPSGNVGAGDVFVGGSATITGTLAIGTGSSYASTTNLVLGGDGANLTTLNDLYVSSGNLFFNASRMGVFGDNASWQAIWTNTLAPTNTSAGIFVYASSTIAAGFRVDGGVTTTGRLVVGSTQPSGSFGAGDLFVGGGATVTSNLAIGTGSSYASTTNLVLGGDGANLTTLNDLYVSSGNLFFNASRMGVFGDNASWQALWTNTLAPTNTSAGIFVYASSTIAAGFRVDGGATTTGRMVVGTTQPSGNVGAGDLFVGGDATTTGSLYVGETASTTTLIVSGSATSTGSRLSVGHSTQSANTTTTVTFGSYEATGSNQGVCLKFRQGTSFVWCYIGGTGTQLVCSATVSCETP